MKVRTFLALAVLCTFALDLSAGSDRSSDVAAIQTVFSQYREALMESAGTKAADLVSARTIAFYGEIITHALNAPRPKLMQLDFVSKFMVLRIRHEFDKSQIAKMTGRELLILGVDKGWISRSSVSNIGQVTEIKVDGHQASASIAAAPGIPAFHFVNESARWKLDLVSSFELANEAMTQQIAETGLTEDQFIVKALNVLSTKKVDERIFSGPIE